MTPTPPDPAPPDGPSDEAHEAVRDVLLQEARRREREKDARRAGGRQRGGGPLAWTAAVLLAGVALWLLVAPPAAIQPDPPVELGTAELEAGLRMDMYVAASRVLEYRETEGSLPGSLTEAVEDPSDTVDITYEPAGGGAFRLVGRRAGQRVVWGSTQPMEVLTSPALEVVRPGGAP